MCRASSWHFGVDLIDRESPRVDNLSILCILGKWWNCWSRANFLIYLAGTCPVVYTHCVVHPLIIWLVRSGSRKAESERNLIFYQDVNHSYPLDFVTLFVCELNTSTSKNVLWHCSTNIELRSLVLQFPAHQLMTRLMTSINQSVRTRELFRLWLQVGTDNSGAHWERKWREQTTVRPRYIGHVGYIGCARYVMIKVQRDSILPDQGTEHSHVPNDQGTQTA